MLRGKRNVPGSLERLWVDPSKSEKKKKEKR